MSPYTILSCKIDTCCCKKVALKSAKTVGKDSSCKSKGLHCVYRQKDNCKWTESVWIRFFEECILAVHSNGFPHFADLPVSLSLYCLYSIRARLHNSVWYSAGPPVTCWCNDLSSAGKKLTHADKIGSNSNSIFAGSAGFSLSRSHISLMCITLSGNRCAQLAILHGKYRPKKLHRTVFMLCELQFLEVGMESQGRRKQKKTCPAKFP